MSDCIELNPYYQWNLNGGFCFYHLMNDDFEEAFIWAEKICRPALLWNPILRIASLGLQQKGEAAKSAISELFVLKPKFSERAFIIIEAFIFDIPLQSRLQQGLM